MLSLEMYLLPVKCVPVSEPPNGYSVWHPFVWQIPGLYQLKLWVKDKGVGLELVLLQSLSLSWFYSQCRYDVPPSCPLSQWQKKVGLCIPHCTPFLWMTLVSQDLGNSKGKPFHWVKCIVLLVTNKSVFFVSLAKRVCMKSAYHPQAYLGKWHQSLF